jgi:hypothetical protein
MSNVLWFRCDAAVVISFLFRGRHAGMRARRGNWEGGFEVCCATDSYMVGLQQCE